MPDFNTHPAAAGAVARRSSPNRDPITNTTLSLKADVDPPPKPWPLASAFALLIVLAFVSLQFILPVTHVRHPYDPHRTWIPVEELGKEKVPGDTDDDASQTSDVVYDFDSLEFNAEEREGALIFVLTKTPDLRPVTVTVNSTVFNTREPEKLHFCIVGPLGLSDLEILKFKALFPNLKMDVVRDGFFIRKMKQFMTSPKSADEDVSTAMALLPFYLPNMIPNFDRYIFLDSDAVLQGDIEELIQLDMQGYALAAVEDCSQIFKSLFSFDQLKAALSSRGSEKPWMPAQPYEPKTCFFDRGALVIDQRAWIEKNLAEAIQWWIKIFHRTGESLYRSGHPEAPVYLALYQNYKKMDASWSVRRPLTLEKVNGAKLIHFGKDEHLAKPMSSHSDVMGIWWNYLTASANELLTS